MKKLIIAVMALTMLSGCSQTPEEMKAQMELEQVRHEIREAEMAARHERIIKGRKLQAEIDSHKPASVRVAEDASDSLDNAVGTAAGVGVGVGALWLFGKMIDGM